MDWHWKFLGLQPSATVAEINRAYQRYFIRLISAFGMAMHDAEAATSMTATTLAEPGREPPAPPPQPPPIPWRPIAAWSVATLLAILVGAWMAHHLFPDTTHPDGDSRPGDPGCSTTCLETDRTSANDAPSCLPITSRPRILGSANCFDVVFDWRVNAGASWSFVVNDAIVSNDTLFYRGQLRNPHGVAQTGSVFIIADEWQCNTEAINVMIQAHLNHDRHRHAGG